MELFVPLLIAAIFSLLYFLLGKMWGRPARDISGMSKREMEISRVVVQAIICGVCYLIFHGLFIDYYGNDTIGDFFEKNNHKARYYVNLFPSEAGSKNYRLMADLSIQCDEEEGREIHLDRVYWPNGGCSYFDECSIRVGEKNSCTDQNDREWDVELTTQKAPSKTR